MLISFVSNTSIAVISIILFCVLLIVQLFQLVLLSLALLLAFLLLLLSYARCGHAVEWATAPQSTTFALCALDLSMNPIGVPTWCVMPALVAMAM